MDASSTKNNHYSKPILSIFGVILVTAILVIVGISVYFHFNPMDWPGSGFQAYVPYSIPNELKLDTAKAVIRVQPPQHQLFRDFLAPVGVFLSIPMGNYAIQEEHNNFGYIRTNMTTPRGQEYELSQNDVVKPTVTFIKGNTLITIPLGATTPSTTQLKTP